MECWYKDIKIYQRNVSLNEHKLVSAPDISILIIKFQFKLKSGKRNGIEKIIGPLKKKKIKVHEDKHQLSLQNWEKEKTEIERENTNLENNYNEEIIKWEQGVSDWEKRKEDFLKEHDKYNNTIEKLKA